MVAALGQYRCIAAKTLAAVRRGGSALTGPVGTTDMFGALKRMWKVMASTGDTVVTRFAPSPTGFLHIGGARTALFNWLFARRHGGRALLRIEDTDRKRSTDAAIDAILDGLDWLGLDYDAKPVFQSRRADRHREVAEALLASGDAYRCYATPEDLAELRERQREARQPFRYDRRWRDREPGTGEADVPYTIRLKSPIEGQTTIADRVQGEVSVANAELDDYVLLRADGTPTYMLAVVVDDHDMGCTHIIRGDDHLNNAFRQLPIIRAMDRIEGGWPDPVYAHVPLIHGSDGAKLSKRHGALGVEAYRDELGILPEALLNYLLRLGWSHGDREHINKGDAIALFELDHVGKSPSRFDMKKLLSLNAEYLRDAAPDRLARLVAPKLGTACAKDADLRLLTEAMPVLTPRANDMNELAVNAAFLFAERPLELDEKAAKLLDRQGIERLAAVHRRLVAQEEWTEPALEENITNLAGELGVGLGKLAQPMRAALTGSTASPGIYDVLTLLGREESLARMADRLGADQTTYAVSEEER